MVSSKTFRTASRWIVTTMIATSVMICEGTQEFAARLDAVLVPVLEASEQESAKSSMDDDLTKRASTIAADFDFEKMQKESPKEFEKMRPIFTLAAEMQLTRVGYTPGTLDGIADDALRSAVLAFESARGLPSTGDACAPRTLSRLIAEDAALDHQYVTLPFTQFFDRMWNDGFVSATGTWAFQNGDKMAWPEQATHISCFRDRSECVEAQAIVSDGTDNKHALSVDLNYYDIERWDDRQIVTKPLEHTCTRYVIRFNRVQKSVTAVRSTISKDAPCEGMSGELYIVLSDGFKSSMAHQTEERELRKRLMNVKPEIWQRLKPSK
jgi:hypothetical protein